MHLLEYTEVGTTRSKKSPCNAKGLRRTKPLAIFSMATSPTNHTRGSFSKSCTRRLSPSSPLIRPRPQRSRLATIARADIFRDRARASHRTHPLTRACVCRRERPSRRARLTIASRSTRELLCTVRQAVSKRITFASSTC
jgi:hypothetical protein